MEEKQAFKGSNMAEYAVFRVDKLFCGIEIEFVQEINKNLDLTVVHKAPGFVRGIVNLRGQIVTIIDLRKKMGFEQKEIDSKTRNVLVKLKEELIGLLVDEIDDIVITNKNDLLPNPPHLSNEIGDYFSGVYKVDDELLGVLDVEKVLN